MATFPLHERHRREHQQNDRVKIEIDLDDDDQPIVTGVTPAGDERRLRGIPAIGRGVGGAIPGTRP